MNYDLEYFELAIKISSYASERGFFTNIDEKKKIISFSPFEMDYNVYLSVSFELKKDSVSFKMQYHKFLNNKDKKEYYGKEIPLLWIKEFLDFRENQAKIESDKCREYAKKIKSKKEKDYKLAEDSIAKSDMYEEKELNEFDEEVIANYKKVEALGGDTSDISWYDGTLNDDWDESNWEDYSGGPDY